MEQSTVGRRGGLAWSVPIVAALLLSGCAVLPFGPGDDDPVADVIDTSELGPEPLGVSIVAAEVFCDGTDRDVAEVRGAEPGEKLTLSSELPIALTVDQIDATADADGEYLLHWRCNESEAGQPWELRIEGQESQRWAVVAFVGTAFDPAIADVLPVTLVTDTVTCDGTTTDIGTVTNASSGEQLIVTSTADGDPLNATADDDGVATLTWRCPPGQSGTWDVTVRGATSNRLGEFTLTGEIPSPDDAPPPEVKIHEDPFVCDSQTRPVATISGFFGDEIVRFASPQSSEMRDGETNESGQLTVRWTCDGAEAGTVWEVTASGAVSGREATFSFTGAAGPPAADPVVTVTEEPFRCDGTTRFVATIEGLIAREFVDFTSPQVENLRQGQADGTGALRVRWTCDAADVGRTWEVTATGATSDGAVTFTIIGG